MNRLLAIALIATPLALLSPHASAQYTGPGAGTAASSVADARAQRDDHPVVLRGTLVAKLGHERYQFRDASGQIWLEDLGYQASQHRMPPLAWLNAPYAATRKPHASHKGSHGDVAVIGGEGMATQGMGMSGAAILAATAALHAGAGRVPAHGEAAGGGVHLGRHHAGPAGERAFHGVGTGGAVHALHHQHGLGRAPALAILILGEVLLLDRVVQNSEVVGDGEGASVRTKQAGNSRALTRLLDAARGHEIAGQGSPKR